MTEPNRGSHGGADPETTVVDPEAAASTELAGIAESETQSAHAWALADEDEEQPPRRRLTPAAITTLAVTASVAAIVAVAAFGGYNMAKREQNAPSAAQTPVAPAPHLDGIYRLDYDPAKRTWSGTAAAGAPDPEADTTYWAFRSACSAQGGDCVATGIALDRNNHGAARTPTESSVLRFEDGSWREDPAVYEVPQQSCLQGEGVGPGTQREFAQWIWEPHSNETLRGTLVTTVVGGECGSGGVVRDQPLTATRVGDAAPTLALRDPNSVPAPAAPRIVPSIKFDGLYQFTFDEAHQTVNGRQATGVLPNVAEVWAFRSACTADRCIATGAQVFEDNPQQNTGIAIALTFVDSEWRYITPAPQAPQPCSNSPHSDTFVLDWSVVQQADRTLRGVATGTTVTDQCGKAGNVYQTPFTAVRMGDVPAPVVLADPVLFLEPKQ